MSRNEYQLEPASSPDAKAAFKNPEHEPKLEAKTVAGAQLEAKQMQANLRQVQAQQQQQAHKKTLTPRPKPEQLSRLMETLKLVRDSLRNPNKAAQLRNRMQSLRQQMRQLPAQMRAAVMPVASNDMASALKQRQLTAQPLPPNMQRVLDKLPTPKPGMRAKSEDERSAGLAEKASGAAKKAVDTVKSAPTTPLKTTLEGK